MGRILPAVAAILLAIPAVQARTWTSSDGRTIEAELVRVEGDTVVLNMKGKEFPIPLSRLSEADQAFVREAAAKPPVPSVPSLFGTELEPGKTVHVETDLSPDTRKELSGNETVGKPRETLEEQGF